MTGALAIPDIGVMDLGDRHDWRRWGRAAAPVVALHGIAALLAASWGGGVMPPHVDEQPIAVELAPLPTATTLAAPNAAASASAAATSVAQPTAPEPQVETPPIPTTVVPVPVAVPQRPVAASAPVLPQRSAPATAATSQGQGMAARGAPGSEGMGASTATAAGSGRGGGDAAAIWRGRVLAHLERHKRYPQAARLMKREGRVHVRLTLDRRGHVLDVAVDRGAGFKPFDTEALDTVRRADPLPEPPPEVTGGSIAMQVPVGFYLPGS